MGAWGTGIFQNDTTADIWGEFKELYNKGLSPKEIRRKLEKTIGLNTIRNIMQKYGQELHTGSGYVATLKIILLRN